MLETALSAPRHDEIDLPIFFDTVARTHQDIQQAAASFDSFTRHVKFGTRYESNVNDLVDYLGRVDRELDKIASLCGARVIEHIWGLQPLTDSTHLQKIPEGCKGLTIPTGYELVAKVASLKEERDLEKFENHKLRVLIGARCALYSAGIIPGKDWMGDVAPKQFSTGYMLGEKQPRHTLWLLDIDPRLSNLRQMKYWKGKYYKQNTNIPCPDATT